MENYFNNSNILGLALKWKYHIVVIVLIAVILSAIFSSPMFITPKFKSYAVVYPANISEYSDESPTEQMYQILQSQDIKDSVMQRFNLAEHYEIDPEYKYFKTVLNYEYSQNVKVTKTPYDAINIEVMDRDPEMAANMADAIIDLYNLKVRWMHKSKYLEVITMFDLSREYGLLAYEQTSEQIMKGYLQTIMGGNKSNINMKEVNRLKDNMEQYGGDLIQLVELIKQEARTYSDFKVEYEDAWRFYYSDLTYSNVISKPFPSDKKAYPIRWLIVAVTGMVTFFLTLIIVLIIENIRIRQRETEVVAK